jgi:hypothetical protein
VIACVAALAVVAALLLSVAGPVLGPTAPGRPHAGPTPLAAGPATCAAAPPCVPARSAAVTAAPAASAGAARLVAWSEVAHPPPALGAGAGMVANVSSASAVAFGGAAGGVLTNATWTYEEATNAWSVDPATGAPSPRADFAFALDPSTGVAVLFGGETNETTSAVSNATWTYDLATDTWSPATTAVAPEPRQDAAFGIDPSLGIGLLVGGWDLNYSGSGTIIYSDVWELNLSTFAWQELSTGGPGAIEGAALAWDPNAGVFDLYGGCYPCSSAVWTFDPVDARWTELPATVNAPPPRASPSWAFDPELGADLLFGGTNGVTEFDDTYLFAPGGDNWTEQSTPSAPAPRSEMASAYLDAPGNATLLVAGGAGSGGSLSDLWRLSETANVTFEVVNASAPGAPLAGATITLGGADNGTTSDAGAATFTEVSVVNASVVVAQFGFYTNLSVLWLPPAEPASLTVALRPEPLGTVAVTVNSSAGILLAGATVGLVENGSHPIGEPEMTDASGGAMFWAVPPGSVKVSAYLATYRSNSTVAEMPPAGALVERLSLDPDPVLSVSVVGLQSGAPAIPLWGAGILLNGSLAGTTNSSGDYSAFYSGQGTVSVEAEALGFQAQSEVIRVPWTGPFNASFDLVYQPFGGVYATVLDVGTGLPVVGANVSLTSQQRLPEGWVNETRATDTSGTVTVFAPSGPYWVNVTAAGYFPFGPAAATVSTASLYPVVVFLEPIASATVNVLVLNAVTDRPVSGASVVVTPGLSGYTDAFGYMNVTGLLAGQHSVTAAATGYHENGTSVVLAAKESATVLLLLTPNAPPPPTLVLVPPGVAALWEFLLLPLGLVAAGFVYVLARRATPGPRPTRPAPSGHAPPRGTP